MSSLRDSNDSSYKCFYKYIAPLELKISISKSKIYILKSILYTLYPIFYILYSIFYILYSILYTLYSILYTLYSILYTLYSILYTLYSILYILNHLTKVKLIKPITTSLAMVFKVRFFNVLFLSNGKSKIVPAPPSTP